MAISAYVGVPGSGKSYEVVRSVIIPAIAAGRRVVSNVYGLNPDLIYQYVEKNHSPQNVGTLIPVSNDECIKEDFFPYKDSTNSFCQPGDLICLDEVWRIWDGDKAIPANHKSFIAEHRHFTDSETGITCDLVVINQSVANLPRFIKDRVETTYKMSKLKSLGLYSRYRIDVYTGIKLFKSNLVTNYFEKYDKSIFPLYQSYDGNGREQVVDKRQSLLKSKKLWFIISSVIILFTASFYFTYSFFTSDSSESEPAGKKQIEAKTKKTSPATEVVSRPVQPVKLAISKTWRLTGQISTSTHAYAVLRDVEGNQRLEPLSGFTQKGILMSGIIDGEIVNYWSGDRLK